jgi:MoaA/NifB/PqqE/SkfB family radical SAM enzyme
MSHQDVKQFSSDKILKHLDRVAAWMNGDNPYPITVEIDMTNVCNHRCPECVVDYYQLSDSSNIDKELAESIIDQLGQAKVRGLIFTGGGEPLCNPHAPDMVVRAWSRGMDVGFITNGSILTENSAEKILGNAVWMRVSLDAATPEVFGKTHGQDEKEFKKVIDNIAMLVRKKKQIKSNCTIGVGYLTSGETMGDLEKAAVLCKSLGVDYIQFRPMQIHHGGDFKYDWEDVPCEIKKCLKYSENGFDVLYSKHKYDMMHRSDYGRNYKKCYGHQFATVISATGKMYICCHLRGYEKYCIGDLTKNSFQEIWDSEQRKKAYQSINFKDCIPLCRDNTFNQVLWNLTRPSAHVNFL